MTLQPNPSLPNSTTTYSTHSNSRSGISPKSDPSLTPLEVGSVPSLWADPHAAQSVQPQRLTSRRKADKKSEKRQFRMEKPNF